MIEKIVQFALHQRMLVIILMIVLIGLGIFSYQQLPIDAFPDISPVMVPVFAEAHGMAPEEVERLITYPIESAMNGLPGVTQVKSTSAFGMAAVYVYFEDNVDIYFARQIVSERLAKAAEEIPETDERPMLGPITTGLGQIFIYYLTIADGAPTDGLPPDIYLRTVNDWIVKFQLRTVKGVTDILSVGGNVLQYQVRLDLNQLIKFNLTIDDVINAVQANNRNVGGQFIVKGSEEFLVRGLGLVSSIDDLKSIVLKSQDGFPILLKDVAIVDIGAAVRRGVVTRNGEQEVVSGIVIMLYGENTSKVIDRLYQKLESVQKSLPEGVKLVPYYEQTELVAKATGTVKSALFIGGILVVIVLLLFLGEFRSALIVAFSIPLCLLIAFILMKQFGLSANLMSLGGLAIGIGMLVDASIVVVENIYRHLQNNDGTKSIVEIAREGTTEVGRPIFFAIGIIIIVFLPLITLQGVEGKMFSPMAYTIAFALLGSLLVALVIAPALATFFLKRGKAIGQDVGIMRPLNKFYQPALEWSLNHRRLVILLSAILLIISLLLMPFLGTEFMPTLEEGSVLLRVTMAPSTSLVQATASVRSLEKKLIAFPEVKEVISRIGRPEAGSHPHPVNFAEVHIELEPISRWKQTRNKEELIEKMEKVLSVYPGVQLSFAQPIQNVFEELLAGVKAELAVNVYGEDMDVLRKKAEEIREAIIDIPGVVDLSVEQSFGQPQVQIIVNRDMCARYGINVDEVQEIVEAAVGGEVIGQVYLGVRRFDVLVRMKDKFRNTVDAISQLYVHTSNGSLIPLADVAEIKTVIGPVQINRQDNQRKWMVQCNVRGRDMGSVVNDIQNMVDRNINLPPGYYIEFGGQFENQQRAMKRLANIVPMTILLIFIMLFSSFGSVRNAALIIINVPLALIGGVIALWISGQYLSVPASVGFIALFGVSVENGIVMVSYFNQLRKEGRNLHSALIEGARLRLRPVLMTALTTTLGLLPLLVSRGIGAEVQRPLATVVVGGLITATLLTLFVLPTLYAVMEKE
ncbi:efflux RND transporter permease subunit [candidate division KSB1 bacterium]|nr:efflux RND transporter permease subunit [candidate division KSB1 bacterium]